MNFQLVGQRRASTGRRLPIRLIESGDERTALGRAWRGPERVAQRKQAAWLVGAGPMAICMRATGGRAQMCKWAKRASRRAIFGPPARPPARAQPSGSGAGPPIGRAAANICMRDIARRALRGLVSNISIEGAPRRAGLLERGQLAAGLREGRARNLSPRQGGGGKLRRTEARPAADAISSHHLFIPTARLAARGRPAGNSFARRAPIIDDNLSSSGPGAQLERNRPGESDDSSS